MMHASFTRLLTFFLLLTMSGAGMLLTSCDTTPSYAKPAEKHKKEQVVLDEAAIQKFLADSSITNFTRTESGVFLVPIVNGTGEALTKGQRAEVKYIGKLLTNGQIGTTFDSSYDNRTPCQCIQVVVGAGAVIPGWDEALQLMKVGDQKRVFIPSGLAYRFADGSGYTPPANIGSDQVLVFDMVIASVR